MALDFEIGQDATLPKVTATVPGSFDGSETVIFRVRRPGATTWTALSGEFDDASAGTVEHHWIASETDVPGYYLAEFVVTSDTEVTTVALVGLIRGLTYDPELLGVAGVEDVATKKGRDLSGREVQFLEQQLPALQTTLEIRLGRTLEPVVITDERHVLDWTGTPSGFYAERLLGEFVPLRRTPVRSITNVKVDGVALAASAYRQDRSGVSLYQVLTAMSLSPPSIVLVTYEGGFDVGHPVVSAARDAITSVAVRRLDRFVEDDAASVSSVSVAGYSATYLDIGFTDDDLAGVRRYRKRLVT